MGEVDRGLVLHAIVRVAAPGLQVPGLWLARFRFVDLVLGGFGTALFQVEKRDGPARQ